MKLRILIFSILLSCPVMLVAQGLDTAKIDEAMGRSGQKTGDVYRLGFPRTDLHVSIAGVEIKPGLALGSWAAFSGNDNDAMVMGDLVLQENQVAHDHSVIVIPGERRPGAECQSWSNVNPGNRDMEVRAGKTQSVDIASFLARAAHRFVDFRRIQALRCEHHGKGQENGKNQDSYFHQEHLFRIFAALGAERPVHVLVNQRSDL